MSLEQAVQDNTAAIRDLVDILRAGVTWPKSFSVASVAPTLVAPTPAPTPAPTLPLVAHLANGTGALAKGTLVMTTAAELSKPVPESIVEITQDAVHAKLKAAMQAKGGPALRTLFAEFGVANFKDITEAQYVPIYAAATKLLEG